MRQSFPEFATLLKEADVERGSDEYTRPTHVHFASAIFSADFDKASNETSPTAKTLPEFDLPDFEHESNKDGPDAELSDYAKRLANQSTASIRSELNLRPEMNRSELQRLRRSFAAENHPDMLPQEFRLAAEQRMKTANVLLDNAIAATENQL